MIFTLISFLKTYQVIFGVGTPEIVASNVTEWPSRVVTSWQKRISLDQLARVSIPVSFDLFLDCCQTTELEVIPSDKHMNTLKGSFPKEIRCYLSTISVFTYLDTLLHFLSCCFMCLTPLTHEIKQKMFSPRKEHLKLRMWRHNCVKDTCKVWRDWSWPVTSSLEDKHFFWMFAFCGFLLNNRENLAGPTL